MRPGIAPWQQNDNILDYPRIKSYLKELGPLLCLNELELEVTEISPRECTKRAGIKAVLDALGPDHGTVYGIGDASNDIALMEAR